MMPRIIIVLFFVFMHCNAFASNELYNAIISNKVDTAIRLIESGANPNYKSKSGMTVLMAATDQYMYNTHLISLLIKYGANVNTVSKYGESALYYASKHGHKDIVSLLINNGADVNIGNADGNNQPIWAAAYKGHLDIVKLLVNEGANINFSKYEPIAWAAKEGHVDIVNYLIENGADVNKNYLGSLGKFGYLLIWACKSNHTKTFSLLMGKGANINVFDSSYKSTPLMYAAKCGNIAIMRELLSRGADINAKDKFGKTPLIYAANTYNKEAVIYLLSNNARIDKNDFIQYIEKSKRIYNIKSSGVYDLLINHINGIVVENQVKEDEEFLEPDGDGAGMWSELMNAAHEDDWDRIKLIASPDKITTELEPDLTVLHHAAMRADDETILILLRNGADPQIKDSYGNLPYDYALKNPKISSVVLKKLYR